MEPAAGAWTLEAVDLQACVGGLGKVWLPRKRVVLGRRAGQWAKHILLANQDHARKHAALSWRQSAETCPLLEMCCLFQQKKKLRRESTKKVIRQKAIKTLRGLLNSDLL